MTDIDVDPFEWIYYCIGKSDYKEVNGLYGGPAIENVMEWLKWAKIRITPQIMSHLYQFRDFTEAVKKIMSVKFIGSEDDDNRQGRLFISVKDPEQWNRIGELDLSDPTYGLPEDFLQKITATNGTDYVLDQMWHIDYGEDKDVCPLMKLVKNLSQQLGRKDCVIIAECADPVVSPVYRIVYNIDGSVNNREINALLDNVKINDVSGWFSLAGLKLNGQKTEYLQMFPSSVFNFIRSDSTLNDEQTLYVPYGIKKIDKGAYKERLDLIRVIIPDSVTVIGENAFSRCENLEEVILPKNLKEIKKAAFFRCIKLKKVVLPAGTKTLGENAFNGCKALEFIQLSDELQIIGPKAFKVCQSLEEIHIPEKVEVLSNSLFEGCKKLKSVFFSNRVRVIGSLCFKGCKSLVEVTLPSTLEEICQEVFENCTNLAVVHVPPMPKLKVVASWIFYGTAFEKAMIKAGETFYLGSFLIFAAGETVCVREGTTKILSHALHNTRSLTLPASFSLKDFGLSIWGSGVEEVILSSGFTHICSNAFTYIDELRMVTIPSTVIQIDEDAFDEVEGDITIRGVAGSVAEHFAKEHGYRFQPL